MCYLGISPETFNPRIYYIMKKVTDHRSKIFYHSHDFSTLIYVLSGSCTYSIDDTLYPVKKGDVLVFNPGVQHGKMLSTGEEIVEFHVGFNNIWMQDLPKDYIISQGTSPVLSLSRYEQEFIRCCHEIIVEQEKGDPGSDLILKALVMKLIALFLKETRISEEDTDGDSFNFETYDKTSIVNTIIDFMNENYMQEISLERISRNMYLSPVYISKIFKEETGDSPINYLIRIRLSKARELLEHGNTSIKTAAKSVGYDDAYYFSKLFKKYYGYPPSKFKEAAGC